MEGVTNEIRNKIKAAVKAKLEELGAYVDEELPDYIMVMIANKRSKSQMKSELSLFLGNHTDQFTDWLHTALVKLEEITSSRSAAATAPAQTPLAAKAANPPLTVSVVPLASMLAVGSQPEQLPEYKPSALGSRDHEDQYVPMPVAQVPHSEKQSTAPPEEMEEDCLNIRSDEMQEQEYIPSDDAKQNRGSSSRLYRPSPRGNNQKRRYGSPPEDGSGHKRRGDGTSVLLRAESGDRPTMLSQIVKPDRSDQRRNEHSRRRGRHEARNDIKREDDQKDEDEQFENSSKNGVNSVVKVTARRRLPASMQATKSLILKAVAEAQKSVASRPAKVVEPVVNPLPALFTRKYRERKQVDAANATRSLTSKHAVQKEVEMTEVEPAESMELGSEPHEIVARDSPPASPVYPVHQRLGEPRFIVTLDGAHASMSKRFEDQLADEEKDIAEPEEAGRKPVKSRLFRRRSTGSEAEIKPLERCKFWPNCRQGDQCTFHHPKTPCKTFPNCTFGDGCLFVHPRCKFDATCTRSSCPYVHSHRAKIPPTPFVVPTKPHQQQPSATIVNGKTVCKFFPNCTNVSCTFFHPPACKYGSNCTRSGCTFYHPAVVIPAASKLKWVTGVK